MTYVVELAELRTRQTSQHRTHVFVDEAGHWVQSVQDLGGKVRNALFQELECEASEVVSLEQVLGAEHTAGEVGHVHASKGVDFSQVSAKFERTRVRQVTDGDVSDNVLGLVWCVGWAAVLGASQLALKIEGDVPYPVLRHTFLSGQPGQAIRTLFDTKERAEVVLVEITAGHLFAMVAHKLSNGQHVKSKENASSQEFAYVDNEVVGCGDNDDGGECSGEIVRVVCD